MIRTKLFSRIMAIAIIGYCLVQGCGKSASNHNPYVANMNDFSDTGNHGSLYAGLEELV
jgi:hypothetical protein